MKSFSFKPFEDMTAEDYANIGLKCGLEVHQQLLTEQKLFCRCPAGQYSYDYDAEIVRHMRPTLSELGEYDGTALMEKKTNKNIFYHINHRTVCTYEFDDTPPFLINQQALGIALEIGLLLRLNMVSELHIARKQYLDGSIPTGFQRTTIVGVNGRIPYKGREIGITQLGFEEDSCREVSDNGHDRVYLTDRLGMPLIEVVTDPDMRTPQEAAEVGQLIRVLCRSTGKVRTGYGATRQDVNVSVRGGTRVEIKGTPQIWRNPHLIYNEARRQCALLYIRDELKARGITAGQLNVATDDVTRVMAKTHYEPIRKALDSGLLVKCVALRGFAGLLNQNTQEHTVFAKEFSDRVRVIACLTNLPNMAHSDTASELLSGRDWQGLRKKMSAKQQDALILVWGDQRDTTSACNEIVIRAREATEGIPSDTRQGLKDGTNGFERVLPGAERMYPDTDLPPIAVGLDRLETIRSELPAFVWDVESDMRKSAVPQAFVFPILRSGRGELFLRLINDLQVSPTLVAVVLCEQLKALRRRGLTITALSNEALYEVFEAYQQGKFTREGLAVVLVEMLKKVAADTQPEQLLSKALYELNFKPVSEEDAAKHVVTLLDAHQDAPFDDSEDKQRFFMGELMRDWVGRIEGKTVAGILRKTLQQRETVDA